MQSNIIVLSSALPAPPWRSPPTNRRPSPVMPTPRKPITSMRICCKTSFWRSMSIRVRSSGRFALGWSRFGSLSAGATASVKSIRLGFLGPWSFRCEDPRHELRILLDFLGFSRSNRDFSIGYTASSEKNFSSRFVRGVGGAGTVGLALGMSKSRTIHEAKLALISDFLQHITVRVSVAHDTSGRRLCGGRTRDPWVQSGLPVAQGDRGC
jgi:hypothetical protein